MNKYSIKVEQLPEEDFKRYYPQYWGGYFDGFNWIDEWRSYECYQASNESNNYIQPVAKILWYKTEEEAKQYISKLIENDKKYNGSYTVDRIIVE